MLTLPYNITCGYFDCGEFGNRPVSPKRTATKFEIEFYLEDGHKTFADDKVYPIKKGYVQIAVPGQVRYSELPFKTMYLKFCADGNLAHRLLAAPAYFPSNHPEQTAELLEKIILENESADNELLLHSHLLAFLNMVLRDSITPHLHSGQNYRIIKTAKQYMEQHYAECIQLSDIAASVNLSPIYFHTVFTAACGYTPHDFLIRKRIAESKKLLWDSSISIEKIAEACGFGCQQYFSKIFKKITGLPPGKYRKELKQQYLEDTFDE